MDHHIHEAHHINEDPHIYEDRYDDANLFYGECEMAKSAVAEVETSCGGVETAIK